jgi:hypothetical protein
MKAETQKWIDDVLMVIGVINGLKIIEWDIFPQQN